MVDEPPALKSMDDFFIFNNNTDVQKMTTPVKENEFVKYNEFGSVQKLTENFSAFNNHNVQKTTKSIKKNVSVQSAMKTKSSSLDNLNCKRGGLGILRRSKRTRLNSLKESDENNQNTKNNTIKSPVLLDRCLICLQYLTNPNILLHNGHPKSAVEETIALTDPKLSLFTGEENEIDTLDQVPRNKITNFSVYDKNGHLCPFETGLVEKNVMLYFSGYIKPIYDENPNPENGIPAKDLGPINAWWISGFDGGKNVIAGFSTAYAEYHLMQPSEEYKPIMKPMQEKFYLSKVVIEYLIEYDFEEQTYEDLLNHLSNWIPPDGISYLSEEVLLNHAEFICHQVANLNAMSDNESDEFWFISLPCMKSLIDLAGVDFAQRRIIRHLDQEENDVFKQKVINPEKIVISAKKKKFSESTTTPLIQKIFNSFGNSENLVKNKGNKKMFCGNCISCQLPPCEKCSSCQSNKRKSGENGKFIVH